MTDFIDTETALGVWKNAALVSQLESFSLTDQLNDEKLRVSELEERLTEVQLDLGEQKFIAASHKDDADHHRGVYQHAVKSIKDLSKRLDDEELRADAYMVAYEEAVKKANDLEAKLARITAEL